MKKPLTERNPLPKGKDEPTIKGHILVGGRVVECWNDKHFKKLREMHGVIDKFLADLSLDKQLPKISKGNAPLFRTDDEEFIVKAMSPSDHKSMIDLTPAYCDRLTEGSLLSPIYLHFRFPAASRTMDARRQSLVHRGLQELDVDDKEQLNWTSYIAMRNLTPNVGTYKGRYDLKGCDDDKGLENEGCRVEAIHRRWWHFWYCKCCWSPARWIYWHSKQDAKKFRIAMPQEQRQEILEILEEDVRWLQEYNLMDYSLLVGIQKFHAEDPVEFMNEGSSGNSGLISGIRSQMTLGDLPTGRQCWVFLDSEVERRIHITIQSREELERGAVNRIQKEIHNHGMDPRDWDFFLEGVAEDPRKSMRPQRSEKRQVKKDERLMAANFPRQMAVRLVKKTRDRPVTMITISIIDFLQDWTCKKKMAQWMKCFEPNKATIPPDAYGERFLAHFKQQITDGKGLEQELGCPESPPIVKPATHDVWQMPYTNV